MIFIVVILRFYANCIYRIYIFGIAKCIAMAPENRIEYFTHNINLFHLYFTHFPHPSRLVSLSTLATLYSNIIYGIVTWRRQYVFDSIFFLFLFIHFLFTFFPCLFSSLVIVLGSSSSSQVNIIITWLFQNFLRCFVRFSSSSFRIENSFSRVLISFYICLSLFSIHLLY